LNPWNGNADHDDMTSFFSHILKRESSGQYPALKHKVNIIPGCQFYPGFHRNEMLTSASSLVGSTMSPLSILEFFCFSSLQRARLGRQVAQARDFFS
jgi:hypothetical protein